MGSRSLDALVAEKIFGCRTDWDCGYCVDGIEHEVHGDKRPWCRCETTKHYSNSEGLDTMFYSTDIAAAWAVVEEMQRCGFDVDITYTQKWRVSFWRGDIERAITKRSAVSEAICVAALAAIGVDAGKESGM